LKLPLTTLKIRVVRGRALMQKLLVDGDTEPATEGDRR
jgi:hypothetical protein